MIIKCYKYLLFLKEIILSSLFLVASWRRLFSIIIFFIRENRNIKVSWLLGSIAQKKGRHLIFKMRLCRFHHWVIFLNRIVSHTTIIFLSSFSCVYMHKLRIRKYSSRISIKLKIYENENINWENKSISKFFSYIQIYYIFQRDWFLFVQINSHHHHYVISKTYNLIAVTHIILSAFNH